MRRYLTAYGATLIVFLAMDFIWISYTTPWLHRPEMGSLLADKPNLVAAALFYLVYMVGMVVFAVMPALDKRQWPRAAILGALFGFIAYATFDLTGLASLRGFTVRLAVIDMAWGAVVSAVAASVGYAVTLRIGSAAPRAV